MFKNKYTISILNSKWDVIKRALIVYAIPRIDETIYLNDKYYNVINVIHSLSDSKPLQGVSVIVKEFNHK